MKYTHNLNLKKPESNDEYDIQNENDNMDILDLAFNAGDIVKVQKEAEIGEPTLEKKRSLYYAFDKERYSFVVHTGNYYIGNRTYGEFPTLKQDYSYTGIQHTLDNDKYYKGRRELEDVACITEEDVTFPTGTYADDTMVCCHTESIQKLYRADSSSESGFVEVLNWYFNTFDAPGLYGLEDDTYYYGYRYKKLYYFRHTYWDELNVIHMDDDNKPEAIYYNYDKYFKPLNDALLYYVDGPSEETFAWAHFYSDIQVDLIKKALQDDINNRLFVKKYVSHQEDSASEENMGKLFYNNSASEYKIVVRDGFSVDEYGNSTDETYVEGLEQDLPDPMFGITIRSYYATDTQTLHVLKTSTGGLFYNYWESVPFKERTSKPYGSVEMIGYYRVTQSGVITIYEVRGIYSWIFLSSPPELKDGDTYKTISRKLGDVLFADTGEVPTTSYGLGYTLKTYEVATD